MSQHNEEHLKQELELLQALMDYSPDAIYFKDTASRFVKINRTQAQEILGIEDPQDAIGKTSFDFLTDKISTQAYSAEQEVIKSGLSIVDLDVKMVKKDGSVRWYSNTKVPIKDKKGQVTGLFGITRDISRRKQVEEALKASQEYSRNIIDSSLDMIIAVDNDRRITEFNRAAQETFGYRSEDVLGKHVSLLYAEADEGHNVHRTTIQRGRLVKEVVNKRKNGELFPSRMSASILRNAQGEAVGVMGVSRDIIEEKQREERAKEQERLAAVGQMAAGISHDFNNLLTVIMGTAQMLLYKQDISGSAKEELETIMNQGERASQLIRQVLDFSRKTVVQKQVVNIVPFLRETTKLLQRTLPADIQLVTGFDDERCLVNTNLTQLQQVITNLALNAKDAMPDGGELGIELSSSKIEKEERRWVRDVKSGRRIRIGEGEWVVLAVKDTGCGMSKEVLANIYEPFFTTKARQNGTGLGMAQVYGIIKQHKGFIDAESAEGSGTIFTIYLPKAEREQVLEGEKTEDLEKGRGGKILVVEDEPEVLRVAQAMLESLGYEVVAAKDGQEGTELFKELRNEIALVLTDLVLPEVSGFNFIKFVREIDKDVPIAAMSGYITGVELDFELPTDIVGFIEKPLRMEKIAKTIEEALEPSKRSS